MYVAWITASSEEPKPTSQVVVACRSVPDTAQLRLLLCQSAAASMCGILGR